VETSWTEIGDKRKLHQRQPNPPLRAAELFLLSNLFLLQSTMSKTRKKKELTFEVIEDHEMSQERQVAVVDTLTEWIWVHLRTDLKSPSSMGADGERGSEHLPDRASG